MTLGIKVGPQQQSFEDLARTNAPFCEVWFNIRKTELYTDLFAELKRRHMHVGLHFWGHLDDGTWTNIALDNKEIRDASMKQFVQCIDIAATNGFSYVNIHPSTMAPVTIDLEKEEFLVTGSPQSLDHSERIFLEHYYVLHEYANRRGVVLTLETVPILDTNHWHNHENRLHPFTIHSFPNSTVVKAATMGFTVANDFGHTSCTVISENRTDVVSNLFSMTKQMASQTRLLHLGFIVPPYNGTDFHSHMDNPDFETSNAIPNKQEMIDLLRLFRDRDDVWALVEPESDHPKNYFLAQELLK